MSLSHEQLRASHSFSTRVFDSSIKVLQDYVLSVSPFDCFYCFFFVVVDAVVC